MIAGFVSNTANSSRIETFWVIFIGVIGCLIFNWSSNLLSRFEVDDPLQIISTNLFCGLWAITARGIFDQDQGLIFSGDMSLLRAQVASEFLIVIWTMLIAILFFKSLAKQNYLQTSVVAEIIG